MKMRFGWILAIAALLSVPASAQTADEIITKNMAARGGMEKIKALKSVRITGRVEVAPGLDAPFLIEMKRPERFRMEFTIQGMTAIQSYDGKSGWQIMPFTGNTDAAALSPEDTKDAQENADFDGPLMDYKARGNQVEFLGKEEVDGAPAYKLKISLKNGDVIQEFIDTETNLEAKEISTRTIGGEPKVVEQTFSNYRPVQGLMFPFSLQNGVKDSEQKQKITVDKVELNVPIDDSKFAMPAPAPKAPAAPAAPAAPNPPQQ